MQAERGDDVAQQHGGIARIDPRREAIHVGQELLRPLPRPRLQARALERAADGLGERQLAPSPHLHDAREIGARQPDRCTGERADGRRDIARIEQQPDPCEQIAQLRPVGVGVQIDGIAGHAASLERQRQGPGIARRIHAGDRDPLGARAGRDRPGDPGGHAAGLLLRGAMAVQLHRAARCGAQRRARQAAGGRRDDQLSGARDRSREALAHLQVSDGRIGHPLQQRADRGTGGRAAARRLVVVGRDDEVGVHRPSALQEQVELSRLQLLGVVDRDQIDATRVLHADQGAAGVEHGLRRGAQAAGVEHLIVPAHEIRELALARRERAVSQRRGPRLDALGVHPVRREPIDALQQIGGRRGAGGQLAARDELVEHREPLRATHEARRPCTGGERVAQDEQGKRREREHARRTGRAVGTDALAQQRRRRRRDRDDHRFTTLAARLLSGGEHPGRLAGAGPPSTSEVVRGRRARRAGAGSRAGACGGLPPRSIPRSMRSTLRARRRAPRRRACTDPARSGRDDRSIACAG